MYKVEDTLHYSPSDLIRYLGSPYESWMVRLHTETKDNPPDAATEEEDLYRNLGVAHENRYLGHLKAGAKTVREVSDTQRSREQETQKAFEAKPDVIFQAYLSHENFSGSADFLFLSDDGTHYEVFDTKLAKHPKPYFLIQLCCYAEMLEHMRGKRPEEVGVVLGNDEVVKFRTEEYFYTYRAVKEAFLKQMREFNPKNPPVPDSSRAHGEYQSHADKYFLETDHLSLVANIRKSQIAALKKVGVTTCKELEACTLERVKGMGDETLAAAIAQAQEQARSADTERPTYSPRKKKEEIPRYGFDLLPPHSDEDVFFDIEGYPLVEGGLEYLLGVTHFEGGERVFKDWWSHDPVQEKKSFESFIDFVLDKRARDPGMHVFHYAPYEITAMRKLAGRYGTREEELGELLVGGVFVDLYQVVKQSLIVGTPSYSIKYIEHLYRGVRETDVKGGGESIVKYVEWMASGEGQHPDSSPKLKALQLYNKDDCDSTEELCRWLRACQAEQSKAYLPPEPPKALSPKLEERIAARQGTKGRLIASGSPFGQLFADLVEFHYREWKPQGFRQYLYSTMSDGELEDEFACLGNLVRTDAPGEVEKSSWLLEYSYPEQDTKLKASDDVKEVRRGVSIADLRELDTKHCRAVLKISNGAMKKHWGGAEPSHLSLVPSSRITTWDFDDAIVEAGEDLLALGKVPENIENYLKRLPPKLSGGLALSDVGGDNSSARAQAVISRLEGSTLVIQGPPGTGKTHTAAGAILSLLKEGKTVGVTSNSHHAVGNVISKVLEFEPQTAITKGDPKAITGLLESGAYPNLRAPEKNEQAAAEFETGILAGSAWLFTRPDMKDRLDYLFIDEAGQLPLAKLIGIARSAKNVVIMGDHRQLPQVLQGSHPDGAGASILEHFLGDDDTIDKSKGVLLHETYRMAEPLCEIVSEEMYEGKLRSAGRALKHKVTGAQSLPEAGAAFVPVPHEHNSQYSTEEVTAIAQIVKTLTSGAVFHSDEEPRPVTLSDILFVAPYNMQVRRLQEALGPDAKVGSVDRFQGQEAPIVIVSLCSSPDEFGPRGMEFVLSRKRMNVALSRAKALSIVVGAPGLCFSTPKHVEDVRRLNLVSRLVLEHSV